MESHSTQISIDGATTNKRERSIWNVRGSLTTALCCHKYSNVNIALEHTQVQKSMVITKSTTLTAWQDPLRH